MAHPEQKRKGEKPHGYEGAFILYWAGKSFVTDKHKYSNNE